MKWTTSKFSSLHPVKIAGHTLQPWKVSDWHQESYFEVKQNQSHYHKLPSDELILISLPALSEVVFLDRLEMDLSAFFCRRHPNLEPNLRRAGGHSNTPHVGVTYTQVLLLFHTVWPHYITNIMKSCGYCLPYYKWKAEVDKPS